MGLPGGMSVQYLVAIVCYFLGFLMHILGLATPQWSVHEDADNHHVGLWETCTHYTCEEFSIHEKSSGLEAAEAFAILAMVSGLLGLAVAPLQVILKREDKTCVYISAAAGVFTMLFIIILTIVWAEDVSPPHYDLGYSFALSLFGGIFHLFGAILVVIGSRDDAKPSGNSQKQMQLQQQQQQQRNY